MPVKLYNQSRTLRLLRYAHSLFGRLFGLFILYLLINSYLFTLYRVEGTSMIPTLKDGQHVPVLLNSYLVTTPSRGDVVIVEYAGNTSVRFVKRITGIPGDAVVWSNGQRTLGKDEYFVVGDNRQASTDSRTYGPIEGKQIIGRVITFGKSSNLETVNAEQTGSVFQ